MLRLAAKRFTFKNLLQRCGWKIAFFFLLFSKSNFSQSFDSLCLQQQLVIGNFSGNHIDPPTFNNQTFSEILDLFIDQVDERRLFIFEPDVATLRQTTSAGTAGDIPCKLIEQTYSLFTKRVQQADSILTKIENSPLTFSEKDTIRFMPRNSKRVLCNNVQELSARMLRRIKYDCLNLLAKPLKENEDVTKLPAAELTKRQTACKKKAIVRFRRYLDDYKKDFFLRHRIADAMSNAIALRCDPHSSYFNKYEKEQFDAALSTEEFSFGFYASENENGEIIISELIPGGPAWKSNKIHAEDVILSFHFAGEEEVELEFADVDDFYDLFYKSKSKKVELKLRKKDNQVVTVELQKQKIQSQENVMNSYVLKENNSRIGYISIPSFYSDNEYDSRQGCANDVAKEIVKLRQDSIDGLILDLRYNGGGSMQEAMGLAGIFIDEGPVAVYKARNDKPRLLKDLNRGSIYDGPLLVLVNSGSASASEFLTATLQDYNRAVIAGTTTYGKGTAQIVMPADTNVYKFKGKYLYRNPALGYAKVTTGKFYRVTTQSHQAKGIVPDIHIPDLVEKLAQKESGEEYFLRADSVNKKMIYAALPPLPLAGLREKSAKRILGEKKFTAIQKLADSLKEERSSDDKIVLTLEGYKKYFDKSIALNDRIEQLFEKDSSGYSVQANAYTRKLTEFDEYQKKLNEETIEGLEVDLILYEAFSVLRDAITIQKK
jgi:carboxyl-terminal processing protease